jgi:hypothetical protein
MRRTAHAAFLAMAFPCAALAQSPPAPLKMPDIVGDIETGAQILRSPDGSLYLDLSSVLFLDDGTELRNDGKTFKQIKSYDKNAPYENATRLKLALYPDIYDGRSVRVSGLTLIGASHQHAIASLDSGFIEVQFDGAPPDQVAEIVRQCAGMVATTSDCAYTVTGRIAVRGGMPSISGVTLRHY